MKIWLDDERNPPAGWLGVKTPAQMIMFLELCFHEGEIVEEISLDHDLGLINPNTLDEITGYDVLLWLEKYPKMAPKRINIHSANYGARKKMELAVESIERRKG